MSNGRITYKEWLSLTDDERRELHLKQWNTYRSEGYAIALHAVSRLALQTRFTVVYGTVETFHCGEYLLALTVYESERRANVDKLIEEFEGFRVVWKVHDDVTRPPESGSQPH